jgi:ribosomal-protein-alanine N-acetyltransferase
MMAASGSLLVHASDRMWSIVLPRMADRGVRMDQAHMPADSPPALHLPIETERLVLRDFVGEDWEAVYAYAADPEVVRYLWWGPRSAWETRAYLAHMLVAQRRQPRLLCELAMVRRADNRLIGACDLTLGGAGEGEMGTLAADEADLGYVLGRDAWGQGYATEAALALVTAGFTHLGLRRIVATCDPENVASAHVLEKAGLRRVAYLPRHQQAKGRWWDALLYELTATAWRDGMNDAVDSA